MKRFYLREMRGIKKPLIILALFLLIPLMLSADIGGNPRLIWDANTEDDLAGYRIYYGPSSANWPEKPSELDDPNIKVLDAGNVTEFKIKDLDNLLERVEIMFALTAYDDAGNESKFSLDKPRETFDFSEEMPPGGDHPNGGGGCG